MFNQNQIKKILKDYDIKPRKKLGQNFLIDKNINDKIIEYISADKEDIIVEIGAGFGNLTIPLAERVFRIYAIEKDKKVSGILKKNLSGFRNSYVISGDILKMDFSNILKRDSSRKIKVIGNLPFYISSPIMFHLLEYRDYIDLSFLVFQKEVAHRVIAQPHSKDYGILACLVNMYAECNILTDISKNSFYPKPKVDSSLIKIDFFKNPRYRLNNDEIFFKIVKASFSKRRKQILNAISTYENLNLDKKTATNFLKKANIDYRKRAEDLYPEDFVKLSNLINNEL